MRSVIVPARTRAVLDRLNRVNLPHLCTVQANTGLVRDPAGGGGYVPGWTNEVVGEPCRYSPLAADESLQGMQVLPGATAVVAFRSGFTVTAANRLIVTGVTESEAWARTLNVIGPAEPGAHETMSKVQCSEVAP